MKTAEVKVHGMLESTSLETYGADRIRRRLWWVLTVQFFIVMAAATAGGLWPGEGLARSSALFVLAACAVLVPLVTVRLIRPALGAIDTLDEERFRLRELYGRARKDALVDALTGLGNHRAFQEELARQLEQSRRQRGALALMLIDVDDLKKVNDDNGHARGDELLAAAGKIIATLIRRSDRAFRVGGDEFAILLPDTDVETGLTIARRILATALEGGDPSRPIEPFSLSIGVSAIPAPSPEARLLYRHADAALYWCKRHGRTSAVAYDPGHHRVVLDERAVEELSASISQILSRKPLRPLYQPIFSLATGELIGHEALVRPTEESPIPDAATLFAAAELANRTVELDMACLQVVAAGVGAVHPQHYLSVNLSPRTLEADQFHPTDLTAIFTRHGVSPEQIVIELTEREEIQDVAQLRRNAEACRRAGMRLAADDVGAGNAGLRLLSEINFDIVKIDLSLIQGEALNDPTHAILGAIQELGARRSATLVAEGIETPEQLAVVREIGISAGQGYLLGRPDAHRRLDNLDLEASSLTGKWPTSTAATAA